MNRGFRRELLNRLLCGYIVSEGLPRGPFQPIINSDPLYRAMFEEIVLTRKPLCVYSIIQRYAAHADINEDERVCISLLCERRIRTKRRREMERSAKTRRETERSDDSDDSDDSELKVLREEEEKLKEEEREYHLMLAHLLTEFTRAVFPPRINRSIRFKFMNECFREAQQSLEELKPYSWSWHSRLNNGASERTIEKSMYDAITCVGLNYTTASEALFEDLLGDHDEGTKCRTVDDLVKGNKDRLQNMIGLTWTEFNTLYMAIKDEMVSSRIRSHGRSASELKDEQGRENKRMTQRLRLLITLWWYRCPVSTQQIHLVTGWSESCIKNVISGTEAILGVFLYSPRNGGRLPFIGVPDVDHLDEELLILPEL